jgi:hypothetical protein
VAEHVDRIGHGDTDKDHRQRVGDHVERHAERRHGAQRRADGGEDDCHGEQRRRQAPEGEEDHHHDDDPGEGIQALRVGIDVGAEVAGDGALAGDMCRHAGGQGRVRKQRQHLPVGRLGLLLVDEVRGDQRRRPVARHEGAEKQGEVLDLRAQVVRRGGRVRQRIEQGQHLDARDVARDQRLRGQAQGVARIDVGQRLYPLRQRRDQGQDVRAIDALLPVGDQGDEHRVREAELLADQVTVDQRRVVRGEKRIGARVLGEATETGKGQAQQHQQRQEVAPGVANHRGEETRRDVHRAMLTIRAAPVIRAAGVSSRRGLSLPARVGA